jgi:hypothetical protein
MIQLGTLGHHDHMIQRKYVMFYDGQYYVEQDCTDNGFKKSTVSKIFTVALCNFGGTL